jgi:hypothetical protein
MLSLCQFERVLELLGTQKLHARAGLLLQACQEFEIFSPKTRATDILLNSHKRLIALYRKCIVIDVIYCFCEEWILSCE